MRKIYGFLLISVLLIGFAGCVSVQENKSGKPDVNKNEQNTTGTTAKTGNTGKTAVTEDNIIERMGEYLENGKEKINSGAVAEGIKQLVSVLAENKKLSAPSEIAEELVNEAEIELARVKAALVMEPEQAWVDKSFNQITGSSIDIFPQPSVLLTIDMGMGRFLVQNAPVLFQFVKGSGTLTGFVNTNDYGQASCKIVNFKNNMEENMVRASLVFNENGFIYKFDGVQTDFVYMPPSKRATILVMERSELGIAKDPVIFKSVYDKLENVAFDFSVSNSILDPAAFDKIYNGDKKAIQSLGLEDDVSYLVVVLNDVFSVRELTLGDVKSGLYISEARATVRIIRVADGKILYQTAVTRQKSDNTHGQGGSVANAVKNAVDLAAADMGKRLESEIQKINTALTGEK